MCFIPCVRASPAFLVPFSAVTTQFTGCYYHSIKTTIVLRVTNKHQEKVHRGNEKAYPDTTWAINMPCQIQGFCCTAAYKHSTVKDSEAFNSLIHYVTQAYLDWV